MILVTGGSGFIGTHLVSRLAGSGERIRVFGRSFQSLSRVAKGSAMPVEFSQGSLLDEEAVADAMKSVEVVYHLAGVGTPSSTSTAHSEILDVNVKGTLCVLDAARRAGVRRVIFASSASVYGDSPESPKTETMIPSPLSPYAISKLAGEHLCSAYQQRYGLESIMLRYFNVYGPFQDQLGQTPMVIPKFLRALSSHERVTLFGDGMYTRDFIYVEDAVDAALAAASTRTGIGQTFNIGSGQPIAIAHILTKIAAYLGVDPQVQFEPSRPGDVKESVADITRARTLLGFTPNVSFDDGIRQTVAAFSLGSKASDRMLV